MFKHIPNIISYSRLMALSAFICLYGQVENYIGFVILLYALLSDLLDGYLARRLNQCSHFGAILDPIIDRIFTCLIYSYLFYLQLIPWWLFCIVFARNFAQLNCIPILHWIFKKSFKVKPKLFPKYITALSTSYVLIPLYFEIYLQKIIFFHWILIGIICLGELKILVDYCVRLSQIAMGKHDTFE